MTPCVLCQADSCVLDFTLPCCVARYIARLHLLEQRQGWLARFRRRKDAEFMGQVEERLRQIWQDKKHDRPLRHPG